MNKLNIILALIFSMPFYLFSQDVKQDVKQDINSDEIINKHLEVTGGNNNWKSLNSTIIKGDILFDENLSLPLEIYQKRPNLSKTIMSIDSKPIIMSLFDGKKSMVYNFTSNKLEVDNSLTPESFEGDLIDYKNKGFSALYIGDEKINNKDCFAVELTKNENKTTYYFDKKSYYLVQELSNGEIKKYSNFKKVEKLIFPYNIRAINSDGSSANLVFKTISINKKISMKEFSAN